MCGIVGYIGDREAADFLMDGLAKLEYRGYDSAGIAVYHDGAIAVRKKAGRLVNLASVIPAGRHTAARRMSMLIPIRMKRGTSPSSTTVSSKTTWN